MRSMWTRLALLATLALAGSASAAARTAAVTKARTDAAVVQAARARGAKAASANPRVGLGIKLPRGARVAEVPVSTFKMSRGTLDVDREQNMDAGYKLTVEHLDTIHAVRTTKAKTVVYPMAGFDAGTAARLFPEAETIVGIDDHAFFPEKLPGRVDVPKAPIQSAVYFRNVDHLGTVGTAVIGQLRATVPGFRLKRVRTMATDELASSRQGSQILNTKYYGKVAATGEKARASHAVVEFDSGPGTPMRRYIHIQAPLVKDVEKSWWWKGLAAGGIDAVIVKGSEDQLGRPEMAPFRQGLIAAVQKSNGVLISDDPRFAVTRGTTRVRLEAPGTAKSWGDQARFGYSQDALVTHMQPGDEVHAPQHR